MIKMMKETKTQSPIPILELISINIFLNIILINIKKIII